MYESSSQQSQQEKQILRSEQIQIDEFYIQSIKLMKERMDKRNQMKKQVVNQNQNRLNKSSSSPQLVMQETKQQSKQRKLQKQQTIKIGCIEAYYERLINTKKYNRQFYTTFIAGKQRKNNQLSDNKVTSKEWKQSMKIIDKIYWKNLTYVKSKKFYQVFFNINTIGFTSLKFLVLGTENPSQLQVKSRIKVKTIYSLQSISYFNIPCIQSIKLTNLNLVSLKSLQKTNFKHLRILMFENVDWLCYQSTNNFFKIRFHNKTKEQIPSDYQQMAPRDNVNQKRLLKAIISVNIPELQYSSTIFKNQLVDLSKFITKKSLRYFSGKKNKELPNRAHMVLTQKYPGLVLAKPIAIIR